MSYAKTPEIPRDHPLAKLIERSTRAHKLPSCEGCKHLEENDPPDDYRVCSIPVDGPMHAEDQYGNYQDSYIKIGTLQHFCAAWEPRT